MRTDKYTKAVLTVIALLLAVIAGKTVISPEATASAQGAFAGVQYTNGGLSFFDSRTGEVWEYNYQSPAQGVQFMRKFRLTKLGQPLAVELAK